MNSDLCPKLMTFVVLFIFSFATSASTGGDIALEPSVEVQEDPKSNEIEKSIQFPLLSIDDSPLLKKKGNPLNYLYPYKRSLTARTGVIFDSEELEEGKYPFLIGASYMLFRYKQPRLEVSTNITTNGEAQLGLTRRHISNEPNHFRGFWTYGLQLIIDPEERFATITNIDNYAATASIGMEDVTKMPKSVRLELQFLVGTDTQAAIFSVGSSWGLLKGN